MAISSARFYFYDLDTGKELSDHPLNGSPFGGTGPFVGKRGQHAVIHIWTGRKDIKVTVADFGGKSVKVKLWAPNPDARETFKLVPAEED